MNSTRITIAPESWAKFEDAMKYIAILPRVNYFYYILYRWHGDEEYCFENCMRKHSNKKKTKSFYRRFCDSSELHRSGKGHAFVRIIFDQSTKKVMSIKVLDTHDATYER